MVGGRGKTRLRRINNYNGQNFICIPIMQLKEGEVTTFGRSLKNDYIMDSPYLKNFISRCHCKVECTKLVNGQLEYKIFDSSMNGTFVNDYRLTSLGHVLRPGDIVNFGHCNGFNIKPGAFAEKYESEFQFIFEYARGNKQRTPEVDENKLVWKSPCCKSGLECSSKKRNMNSILSYFKSEMNEAKKEGPRNEDEANTSNDSSGLVCYIFDENTRKIRRLSPPPNENNSLQTPTKKNIAKNLMSDSGFAGGTDDSEDSDVALFDRVLQSVDKFLHHNSDSDIFASDEEPQKS